MTDRTFQLVLFALTGLGNAVLERLIETKQRPDLVVTRAEHTPYPYEPLPFIGDSAARAGVPCLIDTTGELEVMERGARLLLLATYHRRVGGNIAGKCDMVINLHPSLLPRNRGPNPFFWSILNGDSDSGVTAHALIDKLDAGDICLQRRIPIAPDETQSTLRHKLGNVAAETATEIVGAYGNGQLKFHPQTERDATSYPRVDDQERQLDLTKSCAVVARHINALRDWPLALLGDRRVLRVLNVAPATRDAIAGTILVKESAICRVRVADADLELQLD